MDVKLRPVAWFGFSAGLGLLILTNLLSVHIRSDGGLLEGLGIVNHCADCIRRIGFPFQFLEEGGFAYRRNFSALALFLDIVVSLASATAIGFAWSRRRA